MRLKRIKPVVTQTFALERVEEAHELIRRNATAGRLAMVIDGLITRPSASLSTPLTSN